MTEKEHNEIMAEYNALIDQAWGRENFPGESAGFSVKHDPALARNLEWLRGSYLELYEELTLHEKEEKRKSQQ